MEELKTAAGTFCESAEKVALISESKSGGRFALAFVVCVVGFIVLFSSEWFIGLALIFIGGGGCVALKEETNYEGRKESLARDTLQKQREKLKSCLRSNGVCPGAVKRTGTGAETGSLSSTFEITQVAKPDGSSAGLSSGKARKIVIPILLLIFIGAGIINYINYYIKKRPENGAPKNEVQSSVSFGRYPQVKGGASQPIVWRVLARSGGKTLLISEYGLDAKPYHGKLVDVTWEYCSLRVWLNVVFLNAAFTADERAKIVQTRNQNPKNAKYNTQGGNATDDRIFLLSIDEAKRYFKNDEDRKCVPTEYAKANGAFVYKDNSVGRWWLRSPGSEGSNTAHVITPGWDLNFGNYVNYASNCVRPALWVSNL